MGAVGRGLSSDTGYQYKPATICPPHPDGGGIYFYLLPIPNQILALWVLPVFRHHRSSPFPNVPGGRGWVMVGQGQESPGGLQSRPVLVPEESQPLGTRPPPRLDGGAGVKAIEEENGPCLIEAARKQSHLSGEDSESPTAAGNYNYV